MTDSPDTITFQWTDATGTRRRMVFEARPHDTGWERIERVETEDGHWRTTGSEPVSTFRFAVGDETLDDETLPIRQIQCIHNWARVDLDGFNALWKCRDCGRRTETPRDQEP